MCENVILYKINFINLFKLIFRIFFNFENLFGEDKALSQSANDFFNDQWTLFWDEMKPLLFKMSGKFFTAIFSQPFTDIPYRELFLEDSTSEATENQ